MIAATPNDLLLYPGDFVLAEAPARLRTLLGSCVAITWWHPGTHLGAMCHFLVPNRTHDGDDRAEQGLDGRYADEAFEMFLAHTRVAGTAPAEYVVKVFGGGRQFVGLGGPGQARPLPDRNVEAARDLLERYRMPVAAAHVGGWGHRTVVFDLSDGTVWLKHEGGTQGERPGRGPVTSLRTPAGGRPALVPA